MGGIDGFEGRVTVAGGFDGFENPGGGGFDGFEARVTVAGGLDGQPKRGMQNDKVGFYLKLYAYINFEVDFLILSAQAIFLTCLKF